MEKIFSTKVKTKYCLCQLKNVEQFAWKTKVNPAAFPANLLLQFLQCYWPDNWGLRYSAFTQILNMVKYNKGTSTDQPPHEKLGASCENN